MGGQQRTKPIRIVPTALHRIRDVMKAEGVSPRTVARRLKLPMIEVKAQASGAGDMTLSQLYAWAKTLGVSAAELLHDCDGSSKLEVMQKKALIRAARQVRMMIDHIPDSAARIIADNIFKALCEVMPELADVSGDQWVGAKRPTWELGRIADHPVPEGLTLDESTADWRTQCGVG